MNGTAHSRGVSPDEWHPPFVGAMKIARTLTVSGRYVEWYAPSPAPSLRELSRPTGVTEGVSSDGCFGPTVYTPAHINSEIFERLRSSKYTPSVSHSLDSSLREGAGNELHHSSGCSLKSQVAGDFHRPYETQKILAYTIQRTTLPQSRIRSTAPSGREPGWGCAIHRDTR